jgi:hypothetical protein
MNPSDPYDHLERAATSEGVPIAPAMGAAIEGARLPVERSLIDRRTLLVCAMAIVLAIATGFVAQLLVAIIDVVTNAAFFGRWSHEPVSPAHHQLGWLVLFVPVVGGIIVGLLARYGSKAIRGHGIPEAMEQVLDATPAGELVTRAPAVIFMDKFAARRRRPDGARRHRAPAGRLRDDPKRVIGFLTRSDLLRAHERRLAHTEV